MLIISGVSAFKYLLLILLFFPHGSRPRISGGGEMLWFFDREMLWFFFPTVADREFLVGRISGSRPRMSFFFTLICCGSLITLCRSYRTARLNQPVLMVG